MAERWLRARAVHGRRIVMVAAAAPRRPWHLCAGGGAVHSIIKRHGGYRFTPSVTHPSIARSPYACARDAGQFF